MIPPRVPYPTMEHCNSHASLIVWAVLPSNHPAYDKRLPPRRINKNFPVCTKLPACIR
jgi:hypothetical protein